MIPELGHFALILAFSLSLLGMGLWWLRARSYANGLAASISLVTLFCILISVICIMISAYHDDFSVAYIANNANSHMPQIFKITMMWGAHEGSMLLWLLLMCVWAQTLNTKSLAAIRVNAHAMMNGLIAGTALFILATSNPFLRLMPAPTQGADLNPLLQDFAFVIHPPILYAGYVGLSVPMILSLALLSRPDLKGNLLPAIKTSALAAWGFLTIGIALGSWWAYYELGWGGWWFWDPVENASLLPWLASCALLHAIVAFQKRDLFQGTMTFLAILAFGMSLLGTFLVRSGVLTSVHVFASSPTRGAYILLFFSIVMGASLYMLVRSWRPKLEQFSPWSKELMIGAQVACMLVALGTILIGTLYPLLMDAFLGQKMSVGAPYFNAILMPVFVMTLLLMTFGPYLYWGKRTKVANRLMWIISLTAVLTLIGFIWLSFKQSLIVALGLCLALVSLRGAIRLNPMGLAHFGFAIFAFAISMSSALDIEKDFALEEGGAVRVGGYEFTLASIHEVDNPHYIAAIATVLVSKNDLNYTLYPEKRYYKEREIALSETAIKAGIFKDLYVALGEPLDKGWSMRIYIKPFVRWIWLAAGLMGAAALLTSFKLWSSNRKVYEANYGQV